MVQGVGDDGVLLVEQGFENAAVGIEAGGIEDGVLHAVKFGDLFLEVLVDVLRPADEPHGRHAVSPGVHGGFGGCDQLGTVGQTQVVVGAEVDDFPPVGQGDFGSLRGSDDAFFLEQAGLPDLVQFLLKVFLQFVVHGFRIFLKGFLE